MVDTTSVMYKTMPTSWVLQQVTRFVSMHKTAPFIRGRPHGFYIDGDDDRTQVAVTHIRSGAASMDLGTFLHSHEESSLAFESSIRWQHLLRDVTATTVPPSFLAQLVLPCTNFFVSATCCGSTMETVVNQLHREFEVDALTGCCDPATGECYMLVSQQEEISLAGVIARIFQMQCLTDITVVGVPKGDYSQLSSGSKTPASLARQFILHQRLRSGACDLTHGSPEPEVAFTPPPYSHAEGQYYLPCGAHV
jgi:hypothetical protein